MPSEYTPHEKKLRHLKARTKARRIMDVCPTCGYPLVKVGETKDIFWDYGGAVEEIVEYYLCTNPKCPNHKREFSPTIRIRAPGVGVSKRVLADLLVWKKHGKTAGWFKRHVHPMRVYLSGSYMSSVYSKYKRMHALPLKPKELEKLQKEIRDPIVLIEVVEPERAPKTHLLIIAREVISGKTIYSWLATPDIFDDPTYILDIVSRRLGGKLRRIVTNSKALYSAISQIYTAIPAIISVEPLKATTVLSMLPSWKITPITIIGFFDAKKFLSLIDKKAYIPKHSKPEKRGMLKFLDEVLCSELDGNPIAKSIGIMETLHLVLDIEYYEKNKLKGEKKAPWRDRRTRSVLIDLVKEGVEKLEEEIVLEMLEAILEELGSPWELKERGRKPMYDPKKLAALSILGLIYSYRRAAKFARTKNYDAMLPEARCRYGSRYPSKSLLHYVVQERVDEAYLDAVLVRLWRMIRGLAVIKFIFGGAVKFVIDGTGLSTRWLRVATREDKPVLVHEYVKMYYNVDIDLNAIIRIFVPQDKFTIDEVVDYLATFVGGGFGYMDPEFASKGSIKKLRERLAGYALKHKDGRIEYFSKAGGHVGGYSRRKLGEIPPGNFELRGIKILAAKPSNRVKEVIAKAGIRHNVLSFFRWKAFSRRFRPILLPVRRYDVFLVLDDCGDSYNSKTAMNSVYIINMPPIMTLPIIYTTPIISR